MKADDDGVDEGLDRFIMFAGDDNAYTDWYPLLVVED